jgi:hypothetical protein
MIHSEASERGEKAAVEVLAPEETGKSNLPRVANLQSFGKQMIADFDEYEKHERNAMFYALKIGALMLSAKEICRHGEFMTWLAENVTEVRQRQAYRFMALAKVFIEQQKLEKKDLLLLSAVKGKLEVETEGKTKKLVQQVFDFLGEKSQAELFAEYGIQVREKKPLGGANHLHQFLREHYPDHPEYLKMSMRQLPKEVEKAWRKHICETALKPTEQFNRITYQAVWRNLVRGLRENGLEKKSYSYLTRQELEEVHGALIDVKKEIQEALKK